MIQISNSEVRSNQTPDNSKTWKFSVAKNDALELKIEGEKNSQNMRYLALDNTQLC